jgi:hypothetical protein
VPPARDAHRFPVGERKPVTFRVVVHDSFHQHALRVAAQRIRNGMDVPEFLLFCAGYVIDHHRELKRFRSVFRKGVKDIRAAVAAVPGTKRDPVTPGESSLESRRERARAEAFDRFARWAEGEL